MAAFDASGNVYITGALGNGSSGLDIKTVKLDASLNILWTVSYNGADSKHDVGRGIAVDASGNVYVAGYTTTTKDRDALLIKYSASGTQTWAQTYSGDEGDDEFADLGITPDNEVFVGDYTTRLGNTDFYSALYSSGGAAKWSDSQNGIANMDDKIQQVVPDGLGNFIVSGTSQETPTKQDVLTTKYVLHALIVPGDGAVRAPFIEQHDQKVDTDGDPVSGLRYYSESTYPNVYLFDNKISYVYAHIDTSASTTDTMVRVDLSFYIASSRRPALDALDKQAAFYNYYLGHIPEGRERVPLQNKVLSPDLYPGIDAIYGQGDGGLYIQLVCKPGSDPDDIRLEWNGASSVSIQNDGSLLVETGLENLILPRPTATTISGSGEESDADWQPAYEMDDNGRVRLSLANYDTDQTLVLKIGKGDPEQGSGPADCNSYWSTYYGQVKTRLL